MVEVKIKTLVIPPQVEETLRYMQEGGWWPFNLTVDGPWLNSIWMRFKKVPLFETFQKYESWQYDRAAKKQPIKNHRLAFRNWCENAERFKAAPIKKASVPGAQIASAPSDVSALIAKVVKEKGMPSSPQTPPAPPLSKGRIGPKTEFKYPAMTPEELERRRREQIALAGKLKKGEA